MADLDYVRGVATYFRSHQWEYLTELLQRLDQRSHIHLFVNTSIHPQSLEAIVKGALAERGWSVNRGNEILSPGPNRGTLHGIHPHGMPHFDMNWRFRPDVVVTPMEEAEAEQGKNILYWDETYMNYVYRNYEWRAVGMDEEQEIEAYFRSKHWDDGFTMIQDPAIVHIHVNVETSIHPRVLERFAVEAIRQRGWQLHRVVPNVFRSQGTYYGKLMFLFEKPEYSFDMSWIFNRDVVLAPCRRQIFPEGPPEYLIVLKKDIEELLAHSPYRILTADEIRRCLRAVEELNPGDGGVSVLEKAGRR